MSSTNGETIGKFIDGKKIIFKAGELNKQIKVPKKSWWLETKLSASVKEKSAPKEEKSVKESNVLGFF